MDKLFQRIVDDNSSDFTGLTVDASVSVQEPFVNEIINLSLEENKEISYCRMTIHKQNQITLDLKSSRWPWPISFKLKLFSSVDLSRSPTVRAFLENKVLLGKLGSMFRMLPPGITIYEDQLSVDVGVFLNLAQEKQLFELLKAVEISTEEGKLILDVTIEK